MLRTPIAETGTHGKVSPGTMSGHLTSFQVSKRMCVVKKPLTCIEKQEQLSSKHVSQVVSGRWSGWTAQSQGLPLARWQFVNAPMVVILLVGCVGEC